MTGHQVEFLTKPACAQCGAADRAMTKKGIVPAVRRDMSTDPDALTLAMELGHRQAPVTIIRDTDGQVVDHWSGFRPDKITGLAPSPIPPSARAPATAGAAHDTQPEHTSTPSM